MCSEGDSFPGVAFFYLIKSLLDITFRHKEFCKHRAPFFNSMFSEKEKLNIGELLPLLSLSY